MAVLDMMRIAKEKQCSPLDIYNAIRYELLRTRLITQRAACAGVSVFVMTKFAEVLEFNSFLFKK